METTLQFGLSNALMATILASVAAGAATVARRPVLVHALWVLVLVKLVTPPLLQIPVSWYVSPQGLGQSRPVEADRMGTDLTANGPADPGDAHREGAPTKAALGVDQAGAFASSRASLQGMGPLGPLSEADRESELPAGSGPRSPSAAGTLPTWIEAAIWTALAGSLLWFVRAGVRIVRLHRLLGRGTPAPAELLRTVRQCAARLGLTRCPMVWLMPGIIPPSVWGLGRQSRLVLPRDLVAQLTGGQLTAVVTHELAHLRRGDHWVRLLELAATGLYWWHPVVWWARREIEKAEEPACDAWVVWASPAAAETYAKALLRTVDFLSGWRAIPFPLASGVGPAALLKRRLGKIMEGTTPKTLSVRGWLLVLVVAAALLPPAPIWAQPEPAKTANPESEGPSGRNQHDAGATRPVDPQNRSQEQSTLAAQTRPGQPDEVPILAYVPDDPKVTEAKLKESRAWYILAQTDTAGLLHGLPERLAKAVLPARRQGPAWDGVDGGGRLSLELRVEDNKQGEIFVGFFSGPRWWLAEPAQIRRFPRPGRYTVDRLIPGKYQLGAMIGSPPKPSALGVHAAWPEPVDIKAGQNATASVLVSAAFRSSEAHPHLCQGFADQWDTMDPRRTITVRTVDSKGKPIPFCRVTFVDRDERSTRGFHDVGTNDQGSAYCDKLNATFSLCVQQFDILPERMATRYQHRKMAKLYDAEDRLVIPVVVDPFPAGTAKVVGQVHDQDNRPLRGYYLTLTREVGQQQDWSEAGSYGIATPITDPEGRFEVGDLPAGTYTIMVRHFDYPTHVWSFHGPNFTVPEKPDSVVHLDVEVEAKELLYGLALHEDGRPAYPGGWTTWFFRDPTSGWGGKYFSLGMEKDGSFRVPLSREERQQLIANSQGMVDIDVPGPPEVRTQVPVDRLSKDPKHPLKIILPKPK
jgi:beta-lactamase regulating signal transducer with metallopeptidase domain